MLLEVRQAGNIYHSFRSIQVMYHVLGPDVIGVWHMYILPSVINDKVLKVMILDTFGLNSYQATFKV